MTKPQLFHSLTYADADRGMGFLETLGFTRVLVVPGAGPLEVAHAEYRWRDTGGVMFGSVREDNPHATADMVGQAKCYLVVETDAEVDEAYDRVTRAGARSIAPPEDQPYGGRSCTVADHEGNQWSVGSYAGA